MIDINAAYYGSHLKNTKVHDERNKSLFSYVLSNGGADTLRKMGLNKKDELIIKPYNG